MITISGGGLIGKPPALEAGHSWGFDSPSSDLECEMDEFVNELREEYRLKLNIDYAMTKKYGELHILCAKVYEETIREMSDKLGIKITSLHTY